MNFDSQRYLLPLDGSELGEHAIPWARHLSEAFDLPIEVIHCHEDNSDAEEAEAYLQASTQHFPNSKVVLDSPSGEPTDLILQRCESGQIKMVVMASHGRGGLGRWLMGSVATKVVRGSQIPVLVVTASTEVPKEPNVKSILVPLDGSECAEAALPWALEFSRKLGAEIRLYQGIAHTPIGHPDLDAAVNLELANAREYLESVKERYPEDKISIDCKVAGTHLGIKAQADSCDLVILSSHGRSGFKRWLLGSVAEKLIQTVDKPLMIVYGQD